MTLSKMIDGLHHQWRAPQGQAPVLVFANSLGTDFRLWDRVVARMPADWGILRLDKRGHGLSTLTEGVSIDSLAADIETLLEAYAVQRFAGIGLSVGGLIMQRLALRRAGAMTHLVLSDTAAQIGTAAAWNQRIAAVTEGGVAAISDQTLKNWFPAEYHATDDFRMWRAMLERTLPAGYAAVAAAIRDADLTEDLGRITQPTLAIVGEMDGSTPPKMVRQMADRIPGARFEQIARAGHVPCIDRPGAFSDLLLAHLGAATGSGA